VPSMVIYLWLAIRPEANLGFTISLGAIIAGAMVVASFFLPHLKPGAIHVTPTHAPGISYAESVKRLLRNRSYLVVLLVYFLVASSFAIQAIYSAPMLEDAGLNRKWIGPSQCIGVILEIILFRWQFKLLARLPLTVTILIGITAMVGRHLIFWLSDNVVLLVASHLLTGIVVVYHHIGVSVLINTIAPREIKSTAQTMLILCGSGLGPMLANFGVGWIAAATGQNLRFVFAFATFLALAGGIILVMNARRLNEAVK
jgi:sugar phosphate permease